MYPAQAKAFDADVRKALEMTGAELVRDLRDSHTLPRREGQLTAQTFVDRSDSGEGTVRVVSDTPYARRLYYHPEFNFRKEPNEAAGAQWFEPYKKGGAKASFASAAFGRFLGRGLGS